MRIALGLEYDGRPFCGWQYQHHCRSVQQVVEGALSRVADAPVRVVCAGRTDTAVHALEQVVHFDTGARREMHSWVFGANANLPEAVSVLWAAEVPDDFHARFSAERRRYRYVILNRRVRPAVLAGRVAWDYRPLDHERMREAAVPLLGRHDFSSYRATQCQARSPVRTLHRLDVHRQGDLVFLDLEADGFLHHMVRNIAGVLMAIGAGERPVEWSAEVLAARDRTLGGVTAPAEGLYFTGVRYPERYRLPQVSPAGAVW